MNTTLLAESSYFFSLFCFFRSFDALRQSPDLYQIPPTSFSPFYLFNLSFQLSRSSFYYMTLYYLTISLQSTLFNSGGDALNREFKELLFRHSKAVPPIMLLELVEGKHSHIFVDLLLFYRNIELSDSMFLLRIFIELYYDRFAYL